MSVVRDEVLERIHKERFVARAGEFRNRQVDGRIKRLIDEYVQYHLRLRNSVDKGDLTDETMDDVRSRMEFMWWDTAREAKNLRRLEPPRPVKSTVFVRTR